MHYSIEQSCRAVVESLEGRQLLAASDPVFGFGIEGTASAGLEGNVGLYANRMIRLADGDLLIGGETSHSFRTTLTRLNADGSPETSFGNQGQLLLDAYSGTHALALAGDGKIYLAASRATGGQTLVRLNPDGTLDASFTIAPNLIGSRPPLNLYPQADGSLMIVQAGSVARVTNTGARVTTFGNNGVAPLPTLGNANERLTLGDIDVQSDGKWLVAGHRYNILNGDSRLALIRYTAAGQIDTTFGTNGLLVHSTIPTDYVVSLGLTMQSGDRPLITYTSPSSTDLAGKIARFTSSGALDTTFGTGGIRALAAAGLEIDAYDVQIRSDGKIMVSASWSQGDAGGGALFRLLSTGAIDNSFDSDGNIATALTPASHQIFTGGDFVLDGTRVVMAGWGLVTRTQPLNLTLVAVNDAGAIDSGFGTSGVKQVVAREGLRARPLMLAVRPDGRVTVGGTWQAGGPAGAFIQQFDRNGNRDTTFGDNGTAIVSPNVQVATPLQTLVLPDGKTVSVGWSVGPNSSSLGENMAFRLLPDGTLDSGFAGDGFLTWTSAGSSVVRSAIVSGENIVTVDSSGQLRRIDAQGTLDPSFIVNLNLIGDLDSFNQIFEVANGYLVVGVARQTNGQDEAIAALVDKTTGLPVSGFGDNGQALIDLGAEEQTFIGAVIDADGRLNVAGLDTAGGQRRVTWMRLDTNGVPDESFGVGGRHVLPQLLSGNHEFTTLLIDAAGRLLLAGTTRPASIDRPFVARIDANGVPDSTFTPGGVRVYGDGVKNHDGLRLAFSTDRELLLLGERMTENSAAEVTVQKIELDQPMITGVIFNDANGNGIADAGETGAAGLANRQVYVDLNNNAQLDAGEPQNHSYGGGLFQLSIRGVDSGTYTLRQIPFAGWRTTTLPVSVVVDSNADANIEFGQQQLGSITGLVYGDSNGNTQFDAGEPNYNASVYLDLNTNSLFDAGEPTTTAVSGIYTFTNVIPGAYTVRLNAPALPAVGGQSATVLPGTATTINFALPVASGSISGVYFNDFNENGIIDASETRYADREMFLDADNDGVIDAGETVVRTAADGSFTFAGLSAGEYRVRRVLPAGWRLTTPLQNVSLVAGQAVTGVNIGVTDRPASPTPTPTASINGLYFNDINENGLINTGEARYPDRELFLDSDNDGVIDAGETVVRTAADGSFTFAGLSAGEYRVRRVLPAGWRFTTLLPTTSLLAGQAVTGVNIGVTDRPSSPTPTPTATASIKGFYFNDLNENGQIDSSETRYADREIYLDTDNDGVLDAGEKVVKTAADGSFTFSNLAAGDYRVRRVLPAGWRFTTPLRNVTLTEGQVATGLLIGATDRPTSPTPTPTPTATASISGFLFWDSNKNKKYDSGESLQASKTVFIDLDGDNVLDSNERKLTTDSKGAFTFTGLTAGTYKIRRVLPSGVTLTTPFSNVTVVNAQKVTGIAIGAIS